MDDELPGDGDDDQRNLGLEDAAAASARAAGEKQQARNGADGEAESDETAGRPHDVEQRRAGQHRSDEPQMHDESASADEREPDEMNGAETGRER